jgi:isopentenyl phosphate kinase
VRAPAEVTLLKLGGSLLTDKTGVDAARPQVLARLAAEIAEAVAAAPPAAQPVPAAPAMPPAPAAPAAPSPPAAPAGGLVVAHGSGSFGHVAARRHGIAEGLSGAAGQLAGVSHTQERAAALHWQVIAALAAAGLHPFSLAPSSSVVAASGRPLSLALEPLLLALGNGLLPVLYGDVVLDRDQGVAVCSTERLFELLAAALPAQGVRVRRAIWLGSTGGVQDGAGRTLPRLDAAALVDLRAGRLPVGGAAGTDVTGGMLHRVETALALAARGIPSLIADGTVPGLLARALRGEQVPGTEVPAA